MTAEEMRVAVAEAMGCANVRFEDGRLIHGVACRIDVPDYPNCRNAMAKAIATLDVDQFAAYCEHLLTVTGAGALNWRIVLEAAPHHKAEAFLKAVGRWPTGEGKT